MCIRSQLGKLFAAQFINTGLLALLVNAKIESVPDILSFIKVSENNLAIRLLRDPPVGISFSNETHRQMQNTYKQHILLVSKDLI